MQYKPEQEKVVEECWWLPRTTAAIRDEVDMMQSTFVSMLANGATTIWKLSVT